MSRIDGSNSAMTNLNARPRVDPGLPQQTGQANKSLGEKPPQPVPIPEHGTLAALFAKGGSVSKLKRKLNRLKKKKNQVTPAKGTIACVDGDGLVYLGVEFLEECWDREDVIAGVMAHEWGHTCAVKPDQDELNQMNWNEIFAERRSHEVLADELSGRLMALMGYHPENFLKFLKEKASKTHNLKYHDNNTRAQIVMNGYQDELRKMQLARDLFPASGNYRNDYTSQLLDDDV